MLLLLVVLCMLFLIRKLNGFYFYIHPKKGWKTKLSPLNDKSLISNKQRGKEILQKTKICLLKNSTGILILNFSNFLFRFYLIVIPKYLSQKLLLFQYQFYRLYTLPIPRIMCLLNNTRESCNFQQRKEKEEEA